MNSDLFKDAGCDNVLGSNFTYDNCGVCNGDNTQCRFVEFVYNSEMRSGKN